LAGQVHQPVQVLSGRERVGLEPADLPGRGGGEIPGPPADHGSHHRIDAQALGVIEILVSGQAAEEGLSQKRGEAVACVTAGPRVLQFVGCRVSELQGVVEFTIGQQSSITGDIRSMEFEAGAAVELSMSTHRPANFRSRTGTDAPSRSR
jgi:hypothetical protein